MRLKCLHRQTEILLDVEKDGDGWRVRLPNGREHRIVARRQSDAQLILSETNEEGITHVWSVPFAADRQRIAFSYEGRAYEFVQAKPYAERATAQVSNGLLAAPMPGTVVDVMAEPGQIVEAYQPLAIVEAMKVMARLEAPFAGVVKMVHTCKGQRVEMGQTLIEVEPHSAG